MSFSGVIAKFKKKAGKNIDTVVMKVAKDMSNELIMETPFDRGIAKRNWFVGMNNPVVKVVQEGDKNGTSTVAEAYRVIDTYNTGDTVWVTNSVPYIRRLEDGWSEQRPRGWVARTVRKFNRIVTKAARQL